MSRASEGIREELREIGDDHTIENEITIIIIKLPLNQTLDFLLL